MGFFISYGTKYIEIDNIFVVQFLDYQVPCLYNHFLTIHIAHF